MRIVVTGHRTEKLVTYDFHWIQTAIDDVLVELKMKQVNNLLAYAGMASGIDLHFCKSCILLGIPYIACVPFEGQELTMTPGDADLREALLKSAKEIKEVKNSWMVEHCDVGIAVWSGQKGGTFNVVEQFVTAKKNFYWINPVGKVTWKCFIGA
jgi:hypothetical protein